MMTKYAELYDDTLLEYRLTYSGSLYRVIEQNTNLLKCLDVLGHTTPTNMLGFLKTASDPFYFLDYWYSGNRHFIRKIKVTPFTTPCYWTHNNYVEHELLFDKNKEVLALVEKNNPQDVTDKHFFIMSKRCILESTRTYSLGQLKIMADLFDYQTTSEFKLAYLKYCIMLENFDLKTLAKIIKRKMNLLSPEAKFKIDFDNELIRITI